MAFLNNIKDKLPSFSHMGFEVIHDGQVLTDEGVTK
jgi:hypothetical protein